MEKILLAPTKTIQEVLVVIDREALRLALVVDEEGYLLGTVTDDDIRRALIDNKPLTTLVSEIMYTTPTTVDPSKGSPRQRSRKFE